MDTTRVDIAYRPLRLAWAIADGDMVSLRRVVALSHSMWGGRFNPIVPVGKAEASDLVRLYRADMVVPVGASEAVLEFPATFPHLKSPFFPDQLYFRENGKPGRAQVLDVHNMLAHWHDSPGWKATAEQGIRSFAWADNDPLADAFRMSLGLYPSIEETGIDYHKLLSDAAQPHPVIQTTLDGTQPIPLEIFHHPSLQYLSRIGLRRHYTIGPGWDYPGFYVGDVTNFDDLVNFWNLRAADIGVQFFDAAHVARYALTRPEHERRMRESLAHLDEHRRKLAVWAKRDRLQEALGHFQGQGVNACGLDHMSWRGGAVRPPMMILGEESSLGVVGNDAGQPRVSFAMKEKPLNTDNWFYTQHLVASITLSGGLYGDSRHTFRLPYVPKMNEFYARRMHFQYDRLRVEPERIGLIIDAADHDTFLSAIPTEALAEQILHSAGFKAKPSAGGLITRQLISKMGGVDSTRAFKIPGVRRLIRQYGLNESFTQASALQLIGGRDPDNPNAKFSDHERLFIEPRDTNTKLNARMVFAHLVERGLFRMGAELECPSCRLSSWIPIDQLKQRNTCELCGMDYDATRQLVSAKCHYRRTGVLGLERNTQGAIPVALLLQQLSVNVHSLHHDGIFLPSFDLVPHSGGDWPGCETDFIAVLPRRAPDLAQVVIGEVKDRAGVIDANDVANMRRVADSIPQEDFDAFILFAKLGPFTPAEISLARSLNGEYQNRVILLTDRELEPYHIYERTTKELGIRAHGSDPQELAAVTMQIYFRENPQTSAQ